MDEYRKERDHARDFYGKRKSIFSPALKESVFFSSEGFNHLIFKKARKEREQAAQIARFKLLPRAIRLIGHANTFQEFEENIVVLDKKRDAALVSYWGIIAIFEQRKIKVVVRKIAEGKVHFWSVIPSWTTNKFRDSRFISTMKGSPEDD